MRIAVAGDDIAGLTLALRLRIKGHEVVVHRTATAMPTLAEQFTVIAPVRDLFLKSGGALEEQIDLVPVEQPIVIDGVAVSIPAAGAQAPAILAALGPQAAAEWTALLDRAADTWSRVRTGHYRPTTSLQRFARTELRDPQLRALLLGFGPSGADLSDAAIVFPYLTQTFGRWTFAGGLPAFESVLRERCGQRGVVIDAAPAPLAVMTTDLHFSSMFAAPKRWYGRARTVHTTSLGLPFVGMAAEAIADAVGRA